MRSKSLPTDQSACSKSICSSCMLTATRRTNGEPNMPISSTRRASRRAGSFLRAVTDLDAERAQLAIQVGAFHIHPLGEQTDHAVAEHQLLLQIGALELLTRFAQRQRQQIVFDQRLIARGPSPTFGPHLSHP